MKWLLDRCGIYMLYLNGKLQYIGQSQDFYIRCKQHRANGLVFDHTEFIPCTVDRLDELEIELIRRHNKP